MNSVSDDAYLACPSAHTPRNSIKRLDLRTLKKRMCLSASISSILILGLICTSYYLSEPLLSSSRPAKTSAQLQGHKQSGISRGYSSSILNKHPNPYAAVTSTAKAEQQILTAGTTFGHSLLNRYRKGMKNRGDKNMCVRSESEKYEMQTITYYRWLILALITAKNDDDRWLLSAHNHSMIWKHH